MFDLIRSIAAGFGGKLKDSPEARKLVWVLIVALFFSGCCIFFIAYVSYSRYLTLAGFLPGAEVVASCFTVGIALFMYYVSSHVSAFSVETWLYGKSRLAWQGVIIFAVAGVLVGLIDLQMNLDGTEDVAERSSGVIHQVDESSIIVRYTREIQQLEKRKKAVLEKYWWKGKLWFEPHPVTRHPRAVWAQDTAKVNKLDRQIAMQEDLKAQALVDARNQYQQQVSRQQSRKTTTHGRLQVAVKGVYFLQFLLTLVTAFILLKMDEGLNGVFVSGEKSSPIGYGGAVASPSSRDKNQLEALRRELESLKGKLQNPSINTGINTALEVEKLIFDDAEPLASNGPNLEEVAFLRKYKQVVRALLDGKSYGNIIRESEVSKSTVQNVKRSMRAVRLL